VNWGHMCNGPKSRIFALGSCSLTWSLEAAVVFIFGVEISESDF
jgi:hypothetical protein